MGRGASATAGPASSSRFGSGSAGRGPFTGGLFIGPDYSRWAYWWEFNKNSYLDLNSHLLDTVTDSDDFFMGAGQVVHATDWYAVTESMSRQEILPALHRALQSIAQRDVTTGCMVAMAKIGLNPPEQEILPVFLEHLGSHDQEVRETAALSLGISQLSDALDDLLALSTDSSLGRKLVARHEVDDRTRCFATYGLGLLAYSKRDLELKRSAFQAMREILDHRKIASRNLQVAALQGIGLLNIGQADPRSAELLERCLDSLDKFYAQRVGPGQQLIRAHVAPSYAKLIGSEPTGELAARRDRFITMMLSELEADLRGKQRDPVILHAAIIALGQLAHSTDQVSDALMQFAKRGKNAQARYLSLISLGQIGGTDNRSALLEILETGNKSLEKPWAAIGLGILANKSASRNQRGDADDVIGRALHHWFKKIKNPDSRAAMAVGLGLAGYIQAADDMRRELEEAKGQDEFAGYLCIGLALMDDMRSVEILRKVMQTSIRRPALLGQAASALGRLGDRRSAEDLTALLPKGNKNLATMGAISSALGLIGDRRSVPPLLDNLFDEELTPLSRAFAAVALGGIADKEPQPWNAKISQNTNYRASVETLTDGQSGILDIL